ncbi:hypothetical protein M5K25_026538 [Dendrobium thyrsiflorum]|uniref:Uncharacterized protein n=1 Tax=Dendrobium thyrsiflorum TaxID=117978 RepID=A0ABD0TXX5_DENTH
MSFSFSPSSCIRTRPFCREQKLLLSKQFYSHGSKTGILTRRLLSGGIALTVCFSLLNEDSVRGTGSCYQEPLLAPFPTTLNHQSS